MKKTPLLIIFTTVLLDLIGFGMVIPLVAIYGKHYGASGLELAVLGASYSLMQFVFAPFWGNLSDRVGRRPVLLFSLTGSTVSYFVFGLAPSFTWLLVSRAFAGAFAANISTAQAYIADVTSPKNRARGMGMIGAAFGIGFTLGPPLGGIAAARLGLAAPGLIAGALCGLNLVYAYFKLPESLSPATKDRVKMTYRPLDFEILGIALKHPALLILLLVFFFVTFGFSNMEQTLPLLFQFKFQLTTETAGYKTGLVLMWAGLTSALIQGWLIKGLVTRFGEHTLIKAGLVCNVVSMAAFPFIPSYSLYYIFILPITVGSALINPCLSALISRSTPPDKQGGIFGVSQSLGSLARATGPFCGLIVFGLASWIPFLIASGASLLMLVVLAWERLLQNRPIKGDHKP
ncbi:MAG: MFS transporter [Bdellovibrionota bacterium]